MKRFVFFGAMAYIALMLVGLCACGGEEGSDSNYNFDHTTAPTTTTTTAEDPDGPGWIPGFY